MTSFSRFPGTKHLVEVITNAEEFKTKILGDAAGAIVVAQEGAFGAPAPKKFLAYLSDGGKWTGPLSMYQNAGNLLTQWVQTTGGSGLIVSVNLDESSMAWTTLGLKVGNDCTVIGCGTGPNKKVRKAHAYMGACVFLLSYFGVDWSKCHAGRVFVCGPQVSLGTMVASGATTGEAGKFRKALPSPPSSPVDVTTGGGFVVVGRAPTKELCGVCGCYVNPVGHALRCVVLTSDLLTYCRQQPDWDGYKLMGDGVVQVLACTTLDIAEVTSEKIAWVVVKERQVEHLRMVFEVMELNVVLGKHSDHSVADLLEYLVAKFADVRLTYAGVIGADASVCNTRGASFRSFWARNERFINGTG